MPDSPIDVVLGRLRSTSPCGTSGRQWSCLCPAHDDSHKSLSVLVNETGAVVFHCHTGCTSEQVAAAIGLELKDLFPDKTNHERAKGVSVGLLALAKRLPHEFLAEVVGLANAGTSEFRTVLIPYRDQAGELLFNRTRSDVKANKGSKHPKGISLQTYGKWRLPEYRKVGKTLFIVEGESDSWTLWWFGHPALGIPGANATKCLSAEDVDGFDTFYLWRDGKTKTTDVSGETFVAKVTTRLKELRSDATVLILSSPDFKDPNEILQRLGEEGFRERFTAIMAAATAATPAAMAPNKLALFPFTDLGNAERLVKASGDDLRFAEDRWLIWDQHRWQLDKSQEIFRRVTTMIRNIPSEVAVDAEKSDREAVMRHARASESGRAIREAARLAESRIPIATQISHLDVDHLLLNCVNGTVDLRTGQLREHRRDDLITKLCPVRFDPDAKCPEWRKFLMRVFCVKPSDPNDPGDQDLIRFIGRLFGYCLTGDISEQVLPIFWGSGANGKSTLLNTIRAVMGKEYAVKAPRGLLMDKRSESHPTELTTLLGARMVIASETGKDQKLCEELVKDLTGGEAITARHMRQDFFQFEPTHKLIFCTNHRPRVTEDDDGIWRRLVLIPFRTKFWNPDKREAGPEHLRQDKQLSRKFESELSGILTWMVNGCLEWLQHGFEAPLSVVQETESYREEEDLVAQFLNVRCWRGEGRKNTVLADVYDAWVKWLDAEHKARPMGVRTFSRDLKTHGIEIVRGAKNRVTCVRLELVSDQPVSSLKDFDDEP